MTAPVDVLAFFDKPIAHAEAYGAPRGFVVVPLTELREARAAVAELIEADRQVDHATAGWATGEIDADQLATAHARRRAALARVGGGK